MSPRTYVDDKDEWIYTRTYVDGEDGRIYTCYYGNVMAHEGATWQVVTALPDDVTTVFFMTKWQKKLLVMGYLHIGGPNKAYVMDLKYRIWISNNLSYLRNTNTRACLIEPGCCLEI
ncbi:hypothetical protein U1Q18_006651 [Sarracenia purpurea var. burkii]